jgi:ubiquitin-protein ligase
LHDDWSPAITIQRVVLLDIRSLHTNPDTNNPFEPEIARLYVNDRAQHDEVQYFDFGL